MPGVALGMRNQILVGDAREQLARIPDGSVQCCVTSPPYFGLRDYGTAAWHGGDPECQHGVERWDGPKQTQGAQSGHSASRNRLNRLSCECGAIKQDLQLGLESTPTEYVTSLVDVLRDVRRTLRHDGTLWLNLGDSYANDGKWGGRTSGKHAAGVHGKDTSIGRSKRNTGLKSKDLVGIPWMVAFALRDDGWYLRSDIIWAKGNCMPESVTDRPTKSHEYVFLLTKSQDYFYDQDAVREPASVNKPWADSTNGGNKYAITRGDCGRSTSLGKPADELRNRRTVWNINPKPYKGAHFAVMPEELASLCIKAGTSERGCCCKCGAPCHRTAPGCTCEAGIEPCLVLDPFSGAGTTAVTAARLGRAYLGVDLNSSYVELALKRLAPVLEARAQQDVVNDLWDATGKR